MKGNQRKSSRMIEPIAYLLSLRFCFYNASGQSTRKGGEGEEGGEEVQAKTSDLGLLQAKSTDG